MKEERKEKDEEGGGGGFAADLVPTFSMSPPLSARSSSRFPPILVHSLRVWGCFI